MSKQSKIVAREPDWVLGLDGGGTKTLLAIADPHGNIRGPYAGIGINPFDQPQWRSELERLLRQCPVPSADIAHASFGMPGYGESEQVSAQQLEAARAWAGERSTVKNDVAVAFIGALAGQPGVLVLAGTGSMAWAEDGAGREVRVGGWGEAFGDEGSAYWIGQQALQKLSWALDGRLEDAAYRDGLLEFIGIRGTELIAWYYALSHPRSGVAALARGVDALALSGNVTAQGILYEAAVLLGALARAAHQQLGLAQGSFSRAGGLFKSRTIRALIMQHCQRYGAWLEPRGSPLFGALLSSAREAGWNTSQTWMERVNAGLAAATGERE